MKKTTSDRLKEYMNMTGLKQVDILEKCKPLCEKYDIRIGKNDLSQYVSGKVQPRQNKLSILGMALGVSEAWLMGYDVPMNHSLDLSKFDNIYPVKLKKFPLLGEIACGKPIFANEDRESYILAGSDIHADFCLRAKGDSMVNARILDGDIVFIRKQDMVDNGEIAAVAIGDDVTLKRVVYYPEQNLLILKAENSKYQDMIYAQDQLDPVYILGKAIAFQSDVK